MRGGFIWEDEFPTRESGNFLRAILLLSRVVAYRASLTLEDPNATYESDWCQLEDAVPSWPGFRKERIHGQVARDLKAALLRQGRCLDRNLDEARLLEG